MVAEGGGEAAGGKAEGEELGAGDTDDISQSDETKQRKQFNLHPKNSSDSPTKISLPISHLPLNQEKAQTLSRSH